MSWINKMMDKEMELRSRYEKRTEKKWKKEKVHKPLTIEEIEKGTNSRFIIATLSLALGYFFEGTGKWILLALGVLMFYLHIYLRPKLLKKLEEI